MSRAVKTAAFVIVLLLVAPSVQATELIRVLLAQHISRLTITAEWGVVTRLSENTERVVKGPLHITARSGGFLINGIRVKSGIVRLHARTGSLSINASAGEQDDPMGK